MSFYKETLSLMTMTEYLLQLKPDSSNISILQEKM